MSGGGPGHHGCAHLPWSCCRRELSHGRGALAGPPGQLGTDRCCGPSGFHSLLGQAGQEQDGPAGLSGADRGHDPGPGGSQESRAKLQSVRAWPGLPWTRGTSISSWRQTGYECPPGALREGWPLLRTEPCPPNICVELQRPPCLRLDMRLNEVTGWGFGLTSGFFLHDPPCPVRTRRPQEGPVCSRRGLTRTRSPAPGPPTSSVRKWTSCLGPRPGFREEAASF